MFKVFLGNFEEPFGVHERNIREVKVEVARRIYVSREPPSRKQRILGKRSHDLLVEWGEFRLQFRRDGPLLAGGGASE